MHEGEVYQPVRRNLRLIAEGKKCENLTLFRHHRHIRQLGIKKNCCEGLK